MQLPSNCQSCHRSASEATLTYRKGEEHLSYDSLLQCDICERFACAGCLEVYDLLSGYDFLCHECAREIEPARLKGGGH